MQNNLSFSCKPAPAKLPILPVYWEDNGLGINLLDENRDYYSQKCTNKEIIATLFKICSINQDKTIILVRQKSQIRS